MQNSLNETRYYRIGGVGIMVDGPAFPESDYLSVFRTDEPVSDLNVSVTLVDSVVLPAGADTNAGWQTIGNKRFLTNKRDHRPAVMAAYDPSGRISVAVDRSEADCFGSRILLEILQLPHCLLSRNEVFLHASFIGYNGSAILFTAKSQTGKSTQAALWERCRGAFVVNGDRALLRKENGVWLACGSPYCGTSGICCDRTLPLRAVVILSQAAVNTARRADTHTALTALLSGCTFDPACAAEVEAVTRIAQDLIPAVPFFTLACTPDERAVSELEKLL